MFQQTTQKLRLFLYALEGLIHVRSVHARLRGPKSLYIKSDFPSLADEIAKPRPYMNIKIAAFTVSEKYLFA